MSQSGNERRRFHRIATDKPVLVRAGGNEHRGTVPDLSLRGLLFEALVDWRPPVGAELAARICLDGETDCIEMGGRVTPVEGRRIGMHCPSIELENAARLRRMVELNLADTELLERDPEQMLHG